MSKLETLIDEEQQRSDAWKEQKTAERKELNALSDEAVTRTTTELEAYLRYLDVQADNPAYSASNVLLAAAQRPDVTVFHSLEQWNKMGRSVKAQETGIKVRVSDPYMRDGRKYYGFKIDRAFDISQTEGKDVAARLPIEEESPQMETALRKLLRLSPVPVRTSAEAEFDACYDPAAKTILVSPGLSEAKQFAALAREVYHASAHENSRPQRGRFRAQAEYIVWGSNGDMPISRNAPCLPGVFKYGNPRCRIHLTEKPLQLMRDIVKITEPGGRILDPFAGSGTTVLAAVLEGYTATGVEVTEDYASRAAERIGTELEQRETPETERAA